MDRNVLYNRNAGASMIRRENRNLKFRLPSMLQSDDVQCCSSFFPNENISVIRETNNDVVNISLDSETNRSVAELSRDYTIERFLPDIFVNLSASKSGPRELKVLFKFNESCRSESFCYQRTVSFIAWLFASELIAFNKINQLRIINELAGLSNRNFPIGFCVLIVIGYRVLIFNCSAHKTLPEAAKQINFRWKTFCMWTEKLEKKVFFINQHSYRNWVPEHESCWRKSRELLIKIELKVSCGKQKQNVRPLTRENSIKLRLKRMWLWLLLDEIVFESNQERKKTKQKWTWTCLLMMMKAVFRRIFKSSSKDKVAVAEINKNEPEESNKNNGNSRNGTGSPSRRVKWWESIR